MTKEENAVYELLDLETGEALYRGTKDQCLGHWRNDAMTSIFSAASADQYRKDKQREACNG